jgi:hypothetical protein
MDRGETLRGTVRATTPADRQRRRSHAALAWCLLTFVGLQSALYLAIDRWPQIRDPEYGFKLARLREQLGEAPGRPLILVIGSSRSGVGLDPRQFAFDRSADRAPIMFNFAQCGAGPIQHLMLLRTLLEAGIHPQRILLELHPLFLNQGCGALREESRIDIRRLNRSAIETLADYSLDPARLRYEWWKGRLLAAFGQRHQLLDCLLPQFCARKPQYGAFRQINAWGWLAFTGRTKNEDARRALVERARQEYRDAFPHFAVTGDADRALRALLSTCQCERITVSLYIMPEGSEFRDLYPAPVRPQVEEYLSRLKADYSFELHDFTTAMPDEAFADSHHLLPDAVARFSTMFAQEVIGSSTKNDVSIGVRYVAGRSPTVAAENRP